MSSANAGFCDSAKGHGLGWSESSGRSSSHKEPRSQTEDSFSVQAGKRRAAGHSNPTAIDLPRNNRKVRDLQARLWICIIILLLCAVVVTALAVRVGPIVVDEINLLSKDPIGLNRTQTHYQMPTSHFFTNSEEQVSILEKALDRVISTRRPGLKSLAEILGKRVREGKTTAIATHKLLAKEIPSQCAGIWSTSVESKARVKSLKHQVKHLYYQAGHPASRLRDALDSSQKIRLIIDDEEDATVKAMREYDKEIDQTGRGWGSQIAWFASRRSDPANYARLQARRKVHEEVLMALDKSDKALWGALFFWVAVQTAIEIDGPTEEVGRLESMVEEGPFDGQAAKEILLKVSTAVQKMAMGKFGERGFQPNLWMSNDDDKDKECTLPREDRYV